MSDDGGGKGGLIGGAIALVLLGLIACPVGIVATMIVTIPTPKDCAPGGGGVTSSGGVRMPFDGKFVVTSPFDPARVQPMLGIVRPHEGVDLALMPTGGNILAAKDGKAKVVAQNAPGAGNFIEIDHGSGLSTRYLHLASTSVEQGQTVKAGQKIGVEGNTTGGTGISTGAHLHFEVKKKGKAIDPVPWLKKHGINLPAVQGTSTVEAVTKGAPKSEKKSSEKKSDSKESKSSAKNAASGGGTTLPAPNKSHLRNAKNTKAMSIPSTHMSAYKAAGKKFGIPWPVLAGIGMEETHHGRIKQASSAGALGPMQFTSPTWVDFSEDGNGDGQADIMNTEDAIHGAANKLSSQGDVSTPEGIKEAIHLYNPGAGSSADSSWYVNDVLTYAHDYGKGKVSLAPGGASGEDCTEADIANAAAGEGDASASKKCTTATGSPAEKGLKPNALNGLRCGKEQAPWVKTMFGVGERAGATDHDDGLAVDFMIPDYTSAASKKKAKKLGAWLQANAKALGITYIIYDQKIWHLKRDDEGWQPMEDRGSPNANHRNHLHVSFESSTTEGKGKAS